MKHRVFFALAERLIEYLQKYGKFERSLDHEINISLYARAYWEKKLNQRLIIVFEQNDKMHNYPERFTPTVEELKDILQNFNEKDTPVDFGLAPISYPEKFEGFAYPFQVKRIPLKVSENTNNELADFINKKANKYRASDTCLIIDPQLVGENKGKTMFHLDKLKSLLTIEENALRAVYIFQFKSDTPNFITLWASQKALNEAL